MSRQEISNVNRKFEEAAAQGNPGGIAALYTDDAVVLAPDAPSVKGTAAIEELWTTALREMGIKGVKLETVDLELYGDDTACEVGEATLDLQPEGGEATTAKAKYVVVWKKVGGQWRLHRDIWNAAPG